MNVTVSLILLFFNIFLPGLIFLRFYFVGEFSKQFTTRIPLLRLAFYAVIPGFIIQSFGLICYNFCDHNFEVFDALGVFNELSGKFSDYTCKSKYFIDHQLDTYSLYTFLVSVFSAFSGLIINYLIRKTKADLKLKILRFRNHWYYVLSGEIQQLSKFKSIKSEVILGETDEGTEKPKRPDTGKTMISYGDILVSQNGASKMYSGYVVDYELDSKDPHQLDKLYLIDVQKYNFLKEPQFKFQDTFIKKKIPGDLFIIENRQILNMNITYVPFTNKLQKEQQRKNRRKLKILRYTEFLLFVLFLLITFQLIFNPDIFGLKYLVSKLNWFQRIIFGLAILTLISVSFQKEYLNRIRESLKEINGPNFEKALIKLRNQMIVSAIILNIINLIIVIYKIYKEFF